VAPLAVRRVERSDVVAPLAVMRVERSDVVAPLAVKRVERSDVVAPLAVRRFLLERRRCERSGVVDPLAARRVERSDVAAPLAVRRVERSDIAAPLAVRRFLLGRTRFLLGGRRCAPRARLGREELRRTWSRDPSPGRTWLRFFSGLVKESEDDPTEHSLRRVVGRIDQHRLERNVVRRVLDDPALKSVREEAAKKAEDGSRRDS
jgi:hypothetical protein